jgi:hypothetical protein
VQTWTWYWSGAGRREAAAWTPYSADLCLRLEAALATGQHTVDIDAGGERHVDLSDMQNIRQRVTANPTRARRVKRERLPPEGFPEPEAKPVLNMRATLSQLQGVSEMEAREGRAGYYSRENWMPDSEAAVCMCERCCSGKAGRPLQFGLFKRRHHCRRCGQIFCGDCSSGRVVIVDSGSEEPHRVCAGCVASLAEIVAREKAEAEAQARVTEAKAARARAAAQALAQAQAQAW